MTCAARRGQLGQPLTWVGDDEEIVGRPEPGDEVLPLPGREEDDAVPPGRVVEDRPVGACDRPSEGVGSVSDVTVVQHLELDDVGFLQLRDEPAREVAVHDHRREL